MRCPCEICIEAPRCRGLEPCRRREGYEKWKEKAERIREHTVEVMKRAKVTAKRSDEGYESEPVPRIEVIEDEDEPRI